MDRAAAVDLFLEFLEVAVHQILYHRKVYPHSIFERRTLYEIPVKQSRHPDLNEYICSTLDGAKPLLNASAADRVICCLVDAR